MSGGVFYANRARRFFVFLGSGTNGYLCGIIKRQRQ
nr:MAG TPA: Heterogeneous nuclear ribonucleoprotein [Caudoviricetes sp.]